VDNARSTSVVEGQLVDRLNHWRWQVPIRADGAQLLEALTHQRLSLGRCRSADILATDPADRPVEMLGKPLENPEPRLLNLARD